MSERTTNRPILNVLLDKVSEGDIIVVHSLDRISLTTVDLLQGVALRSVKDFWFDMTDENPFSELLLTVLSGLSEYERKMIRMRQQECITQAKFKGKFKGKVKKYTAEHPGMNHAIELYEKGDSTVKEICAITKVSRSSFYRELKKREKNNALVAKRRKCHGEFSRKS
ncbi:recombinase family protein [Anaerobacillus sp. 1_MG-2023]|uniref:recombinase family protein n=1 Tax=Anaerobacillus sp. 1_MG-2023 TaxID=3062655 RepID=UPI0026E298AD|nr:recombinase family protein [Anaerobacillus sp. 1_MG-2023]MDO6654993.1 recombinase family protein [Anaerobacillus sp. 1_MG-2023]